MTLPSIVDGTQKHYEAHRRLSEKAYAQTAGVPDEQGSLTRFWRRLRRISPAAGRGSKNQSDVLRPPAYSK